MMLGVARGLRRADALTLDRLGPDLDTCDPSGCASPGIRDDAKPREAARPAPPGFRPIWSAWHDPAARILNVDLLTVLIAILLPWSTTGVGIAVVLWLIALVPTLEPRRVAAIAEAPDRRAADRLGRAGAGRGRCGRTRRGAERLHGGQSRPRNSWCCRCCSIISNARRAALGVHRLSGVLHAAGAWCPASSRSIPIFRQSSISRADPISRSAESSSRTISTRVRSSRCARWRWPIRS